MTNKTKVNKPLLRNVNEPSHLIARSWDYYYHIRERERGKEYETKGVITSPGNLH